MAKKEHNDAEVEASAAEPVTHEAPQHGTVVNYGLPGVITMTVPFGIHPESHQQVPLDSTEAVIAEARIQPVKAKAVKKVVTADSDGVETA